VTGGVARDFISPREARALHAPIFVVPRRAYGRQLRFSMVDQNGASCTVAAAPLGAVSNPPGTLSWICALEAPVFSASHELRAQARPPSSYREMHSLVVHVADQRALFTFLKETKRHVIGSATLLRAGAETKDGLRAQPVRTLVVIKPVAPDLGLHTLQVYAETPADGEVRRTSLTPAPLTFAQADASDQREQGAQTNALNALPGPPPTLPPGVAADARPNPSDSVPLLTSDEFDVNWDAPVMTTAACRIHKARWRKQGSDTLVCIKEFKTEGLPQEEVTRAVMAERRMQSIVPHGNICRVHGWIDEPPCLVLDWLEGTLHSALFPSRGRPCTLTARERLVVLTDAACALVALHSAQVRCSFLVSCRHARKHLALAAVRSPTST
jgi:hypothetical protein